MNDTIAIFIIAVALFVAVADCRLFHVERRRRKIIEAARRRG